MEHEEWMALVGKGRKLITEASKKSTITFQVTVSKLTKDELSWLKDMVEEVEGAYGLGVKKDFSRGLRFGKLYTFTGDRSTFSSVRKDFGEIFGQMDTSSTTFSLKK